VPSFVSMHIRRRTSGYSVGMKQLPWGTLSRPQAGTSLGHVISLHIRSQVSSGSGNGLWVVNVFARGSAHHICQFASVSSSHEAQSPQHGGAGKVHSCQISTLQKILRSVFFFTRTGRGFGICIFPMFELRATRRIAETMR